MGSLSSWAVTGDPDAGAGAPGIDLAPTRTARHTGGVRWPTGMASLVASAMIATADAAPSDTWRDLLEPHAAEVEALLTHARQALRTVTDEVLPSDAEWAVDARLRYVRDARALMRHARSLSPAQPEVLELLGRAADELGDTAEALDALTAHVRVRGPERASPDVLGRLGALHLRTGQADAALRYLRLAQRPLRADTAPALVHLATALTTRGEIAAAIDTLRGVMPAQPPSFYSHELTLVAFALAVLYDRDEQRTAALEVLAPMRATLEHAFGAQVRAALAPLRFTPAEDQHYYLALLYEVQSQDVEARAAWALYAASGAPPWRARALAHIHDLDRRHRAAARPAASPPARIRRTVAP